MFKTKKIEIRSQFLNPIAFGILKEMVEYAKKEFGIEAVVTDTVTTLAEDRALKRVSSTHREGRAFDISSRNFTKEQSLSFINHFTKEYGFLGAIAKSTGKPELIIWHNAGTGPHFHVQLSRTHLVIVDSDKLKQAEAALDA